MKAAITAIDRLGSDPTLPKEMDISREGQWVRFYISAADNERGAVYPGEESLDFMVCSPAWLKAAIQSEGGPMVGRHRLIMDPFDLEAGIEFMKSKILGESASDYRELTDRLAGLGYCEFEDYISYGTEQ